MSLTKIGKFHELLRCLLDENTVKQTMSYLSCNLPPTAHTKAYAKALLINLISSVSFTTFDLLCVDPASDRIDELSDIKLLSWLCLEVQRSKIAANNWRMDEISGKHDAMALWVIDAYFFVKRGSASLERKSARGSSICSNMLSTTLILRREELKMSGAKHREWKQLTSFVLGILLDRKSQLTTNFSRLVKRTPRFSY